MLDGAALVGDVVGGDDGVGKRDAREGAAMVERGEGREGGRQREKRDQICAGNSGCARATDFIAFSSESAAISVIGYRHAVPC